MIVYYMNLEQSGKVFAIKFVGTGPSSYQKRIYRAAVSQRLRNTAVDDIRVTTIRVYTLERRKTSFSLT